MDRVSQMRDDDRDERGDAQARRRASTTASSVRAAKSSTCCAVRCSIALAALGNTRSTVSRAGEIGEVDHRVAACRPGRRGKRECARHLFVQPRDG